MWTWIHEEPYEGMTEDCGMTTQEVINRINNSTSYYIEYDIIHLDNPNPKYHPYEFMEVFGTPEDFT